MIATKELTKPAALAGRLEMEKLLPRLGLGVALAVSAALNLWNLAQNGYGNTYYAVAVQSMLTSWKNFFFAAYDAGGFITVDKPPVALWIQALSAKIFGFNGLALLVPEALAGVASVALLYFLVKRLFGPLAGFLAAMALAVTPIAVAVERSNNTDTWLMFTLLLAAWAITLATERGRFRLLGLSMALVGIAFNIKMLAAWIILPAFVLLYFVAAPLSWKKRLLHLTLAGVIALTVSLSWAVAVDLTPASQRPYIGGSQSNSVLELALGYNGLGRITGQGETMGGGPNAADRGSFTPPTNLPGSTGTSGSTTPGDFTRPDGGFAGGGPPDGAGGIGGSFNTGTPGVLRLVNSELAAQWSWLLPLAGLGLLAAGFGVRRKLPLEPKGQALLLWGGWLLTYGAVFSMASGIFHNYYLIMLAPAAAALAGIGVAALWAAYRRGGRRAWLLPLALLITTAWQVKVLADFPDWSAWLAPLVIGGSVLAAGGLVAVRLLTRQAWRRVAPALLAGGLLALALAPTAWASTAVLAAGNGTIPTVGPSQLSGQGGFGGAGRPGEEMANSSLIAYLEANQGDTFYLVAVSSANQASSIALATGQPVLAMGGFTGSDPAMTVEKLQQLAATGQVRYVMIGGGGPGGTGSDLTSWVQANGTAVDPSLYGGTTTMGMGGGPSGAGNGTLYDRAAP
jgi:4-amino-4-deoxy-L-arabinose transferase-like glycosyltransferase